MLAQHPAETCAIAEGARDSGRRQPLVRMDDLQAGVEDTLATGLKHPDREIGILGGAKAAADPKPLPSNPSGIMY